MILLSPWVLLSYYDDMNTNIIIVVPILSLCRFTFSTYPVSYLPIPIFPCLEGTTEVRMVEGSCNYTSGWVFERFEMTSSYKLLHTSVLTNLVTANHWLELVVQGRWGLQPPCYSDFQGWEVSTRTKVTVRRDKTSMDLRWLSLE